MPYSLLALCARINGSNAQYQQLRQTAQTITHWPEVIKLAETNGIGPLVYTHLKAAEVDLPKASFRELQGLYLRHQHTNRVRGQVLAQILYAYQNAGIEALVLKGAALAHISYPQPGLRPMRDIDVLVKKDKMWQAQHILEELGFNAPQSFPGSDDTHHHLTAAGKTVEGFLVSVEVHHNLFLERIQQSLSFEELSGDPLPFTLSSGIRAQTLGCEEMLWHMCIHIAQISQPFRLIWVADIVGFAEMFAGQIDWSKIRRDYPRVLNILALFNAVTPLSESLKEKAGLTVGRPAKAIGAEFDGWPRQSIKALKKRKNSQKIVQDTLWPPEWWLCLYHGVAPDHGLVRARWLGHPLHIAGFAKQLLFEKK